LLAIDERSVLAANIDDDVIAAFGNDLGMVARHARIGDDEILISFTAYAERRVIERGDLLLASDNHHKFGELPGKRAQRCHGLCGHTRSFQIVVKEEHTEVSAGTPSWGPGEDD